jgi:hydrogenase/urease accessory protein HupE
MKTRLAVVAAISGLLLGSVLVAPAGATHMCDPDFQVGCNHPEQGLDDMVHFMCDKFVVVDKVLELVTDCGTQ